MAQDKILESMEMVRKFIVDMQTSDREISLIFGNFDQLHTGHLKFIKTASKFAPILVVCVQGYSKTKLEQSFQERIKQISEVSDVSFVIPMYENIESYISIIKPKFVIKGFEFSKSVNPELDLIESYGGHLIFTSGATNHNHGDYTSNYAQLRNEKDQLKNTKFTNSSSTIIEYIERLYENKIDKVVVLGELIIDEYFEHEVIGLSQEDPVVVVRQTESNKYVGGAGIVSLHLMPFANELKLISVGKLDQNYNWAQQKLQEKGIESIRISDDTRPTILKKRYRNNGRNVFRVNEFQDHPIEPNLENKLLKTLLKECADANLIVISDFNYGTISGNLVKNLLQCLNLAPMVLGDSQSSSQKGDCGRFVDLDLLTPTEYEARLSLGDFESSLPVIVSNFKQKTRCRNLIITLGVNGVLVSEGKYPKTDFQIIPAYDIQVYDVSGAGDSLLAFTAVSFYSGNSLNLSAQIGNLAAATQLTNVGNIPIDLEKILSMKKIFA